MIDEDMRETGRSTNLETLSQLWLQFNWLICRRETDGRRKKIRRREDEREGEGRRLFGSASMGLKEGRKTIILRRVKWSGKGVRKRSARREEGEEIQGAERYIVIARCVHTSIGLTADRRCDDQV